MVVVQDGDVLTLVAPYDVASGSGLLVGSVFGVAKFAASSGANVEAAVEGVYEFAKVSAQAWTQGALIYWDNAAKNCTTTVGTNKLIVAVAAAANSLGDGQGPTQRRLHRVAGARPMRAVPPAPRDAPWMTEEAERFRPGLRPPVVLDPVPEYQQCHFESVQALGVPPLPGLDHQLHQLVPGGIDLLVVPRIDALHQATLGEHHPAPAVEVHDDPTLL
jgi:predicted RecA/RadA family phage recombinase